MRWKYIDGYGEKYRIYENGTVVSYSPRYLFDGDKKIIADYEPHILNPWHERKGYLMVGLYDDNGKVKCEKVHRLVAKAFLPNPENKRCVCHKDNNKENNDVSNLYWGTDLENSRQAWRDGLIKTKKSVAQVDVNGNIIRIFDSVRGAERETGISQANISACATGKIKTSGGYVWQFM